MKLCVDAVSGWSNVDRQAGVGLPSQLNSVVADGRQHWLRYQQVKYSLYLYCCIHYTCIAVFITPVLLYSLYLYCCIHYTCIAVFTIPALLYSLYLYCCIHYTCIAVFITCILQYDAVGSVRFSSILNLSE